MRNHLSHRWPDRAGSTPLSVSLSPPRRPRHRGGRVFRGMLITLGCLAGLALLVWGAFWGGLVLAERLIPQTAQPPVLPSRLLPQSQSEDWADQKTLPWGEPDPSVQIELDTPSQQVLTPQEIYQQVLPSVVCVQADHGSSYSVGSGVVLTENGYLVTNYHVIEGSSAIEVMLLSNQHMYDGALLIGYDEDLDLAVLKVDAQGLTPARLADSDLLQVGDQVYAIGNPMGYLYGTMTDGIVSSLAREVEVDSRDMTLIQTSAALNSGNSGGALVDVYGQVVGITSAKITGVNDDVVTEGIGLAIPITDSLPFLNSIVQTGRTCRPALGVTCNIYTQDSRQRVVVAEITPGSPAQGVLQAGDEITALNGQAIDSFYQLTRGLYAAGVGGTVELTVLREGQPLTLSITLYDSLAAQS